MLGGPGTTIAMPSIVNGAANQSGPTRLVSSDASSVLGVTNLDVATLGGLDGRVSSLEAGIGALSRFASLTRREARQGIAPALVLASAPLPSAPGKLSYVLNGATFRGEFALGGAIAYRLDTNAPLAVTAGLSGAGGGSVGVRFGVLGEL